MLLNLLNLLKVKTQFSHLEMGFVSVLYTSVKTTEDSTQVNCSKLQNTDMDLLGRNHGQYDSICYLGKDGKWVGGYRI